MQKNENGFIQKNMSQDKVRKQRKKGGVEKEESLVKH